MSDLNISTSPAAPLEIHSAPKALGFAASQVATIAKSIADQLGFKPGDDLVGIVKRLGGKISHVDMWSAGSSDSGSIEIRGNTFEIRLSIATGPLRDRFTIAHEIGHFVLHYLYRKRVLHEPIGELVAQRYGTNQAEREANWFAAAFLMPEAEFKAEYVAAAGDHSELSQKFLVSTAASKVRAQSLGLEPRL